MRKFRDLEGLRLKVRTTEQEVVASVWINGERVADIATLSLKIVGEPGSKGYQAWIDAVSALWTASLSERLGVPGVRSKRREPDYRGEK